MKSLSKKIHLTQERNPDGDYRSQLPKIRLKEPSVDKNGVSKELARDIKNRIITELEINEHYTNSNFKMEDLSKLIGLPKHQTSKIINQEFGMDFNSLVNKYRIERARELFLSQSDFQISDVMYDVGFNNSTTFNRAFKKYTDNLTPTDFLAIQGALYQNS
ncbi:helix-turn-helix transcriptional regulator [Muricauda sp. NFXS6]|uniref:helix-turn-helix domain-containing protein n=1 Tax=Allomuricauda sp. NFXS6 TaxID=2819094 RepID=UPI0032DEA498